MVGKNQIQSEDFPTATLRNGKRALVAVRMDGGGESPFPYALNENVVEDQHCALEGATIFSSRASRASWWRALSLAPAPMALSPLPLFDLLAPPATDPARALAPN